MARKQHEASPPAAWIVGESPVRLWGLTGKQRLERQLRSLGLSRIVSGAGAGAAADGAVLLVRADFLFDDRTLGDLLASGDTILEVAVAGGRTQAVAANVSATRAAAALAVLEGTVAARSVENVVVRDSATLGSSYVRKLLKSNPPLVLPVRAERAAVLERYLFDCSYKGVTDLVTKFVWPTPARWVAHLCAGLGIKPNAVTAMSLLLVIAAYWLFSEGRFAAGLVAAWLMTFLDTVDGKLARVTVASTKFGHLFDHGIDLIHPPLWYLAWACGVVGGFANLSPMVPTLIAILAGYVGGRAVEGTFTRVVGGFSIFTWQPFDSFFRLITGRRNPNLLLLTGFALAGEPAMGLVAVAVWTVVSTIVLIARLAQASAAKARQEKLRPWLEGLGTDLSGVPRYARSFAPDPAAASRLAR